MLCIVMVKFSGLSNAYLIRERNRKENCNLNWIFVITDDDVDRDCCHVECYLKPECKLAASRYCKNPPLECAQGRVLMVNLPSSQTMCYFIWEDTGIGCWTELLFFAAQIVLSI